MVVNHNARRCGLGNKRFKAVNALERVVVEAENEVCRRKQAFGFVGEARSDYNVVGAGQKDEIFWRGVRSYDADRLVAVGSKNCGKPEA